MLARYLSVLTISGAILFSFKAMAEPEFQLGKGESQFKWGQILAPDSAPSDMKLRLGFRLQTAMEVSREKDSNGQELAEQHDFYARRVRFQLGADFNKNFSYYMDVRNDRANQDDRGEEQFNIGDAFVDYKTSFSKNHKLSLRFFRAKVDVSRTQTVSSSRLIFHDRAAVTDFAAGYVSQSRRATNAQVLGNWNHRVHYQLVIGDGIQSGDLEDAKGNSADSLEQQKFMFGGKVKLSPFTGWEEKQVTETYFGEGQHLTLGVGHFVTSGIKFERTDATPTTHTDKITRRLTNVEFSMHYRWLSLQAEYFIFDNMVEDFTATNLNISDTSGWYAHGELVLPGFNYIAPFVRYESWDKFDADNYNLTSSVMGFSYYLQGNKIKLALMRQMDKYESAISSTGRPFKEQSFKLTSQWHY